MKKSIMLISIFALLLISIVSAKEIEKSTEFKLKGCIQNEFCAINTETGKYVEYYITDYKVNIKPCCKPYSVIEPKEKIVNCTSMLKFDYACESDLVKVQGLDCNGFMFSNYGKETFCKLSYVYNETEEVIIVPPPIVEPVSVHKHSGSSCKYESITSNKLICAPKFSMLPGEKDYKIPGNYVNGILRIILSKETMLKYYK